MPHTIRTARRPLFALAICGIVLSGAGSASAAIIRLKESATVDSSVVLLSDVADVFHGDPAVARSLQDVILQPAPAADGSATIDFASIRERLRTRGFNVTDLEFTGRSQVTVTARPAAPPAATADQAAEPTGPPASSWQVTRANDLLSQAIGNYLQTARLGAIDVETQVRPHDSPLVVAGQSSGFEIRGGRAPWDQWQAFTVRFIDRDEQLQRIEVRARVVSHPFVPTARQSLPGGHVIRQQDILWEQTAVDDAPILKPGDLIGRETTRNIRPGQMIEADHIRQIPLVRRGDVVTAMSRVGGVTVRRQLTAKGDGAKGDRIILTGLDNREQLEGTVVGYHTVLVLESPSTAARRRPALTSRREEPSTAVPFVVRGQTRQGPTADRRRLNYEN